MIDILTTTSTTGAGLGIPFDWSVIPAGRAASAAWHDYSDPCRAAGHNVEALEVRALELDDSLCTAVVLSLFCDRRAGADVVLPVNQTDRRGWCGDEFFGSADADVPRDTVDQWGSHLWLCYITKTTVDVLERARFAAWEALQWMVRAGVAERVDVDAVWTGPAEDRLALRPQVWQGGSAQPVYDVLWGTTIRRVA
jgi:phage gp46-like protein